MFPEELSNNLNPKFPQTNIGTINDAGHKIDLIKTKSKGRNLEIDWRYLYKRTKFRNMQTSHFMCNLSLSFL